MSLLSEKVSTVLSLQNLASTEVALAPNTLIRQSVNSIIKTGVCSPRVLNDTTMVIDSSTGQPINGSGLALGTVTINALVPLETAGTLDIFLYSFGNPDGSGLAANYGISATYEEVNGKYYNRVSSNYSTAQETTNAPYFGIILNGTDPVSSGTVAVTIEFVNIL